MALELVNHLQISTDSIAEHVFKEFEHRDPVIYKEILSNFSKVIALKSMVQDVTNWYRGTLHELSTSNSPLAVVFKARRSSLIKRGLNVPGIMLVVRKFESIHMLDVRRKGVNFMPSRMINDYHSVLPAIKLQCAVMVIDMIVMLLHIAGVNIVEIEDTVLRKVTDDLLKGFDGSLALSLQPKICSFCSMNIAPTPQVISCIYDILQTCLKDGILWSVITGLYSEKDQWQWITTALMAITVMIDAVYTDNAILLGAIQLALVWSKEFYGKMRVLLSLYEVGGIVFKRP